MIATLAYLLMDKLALGSKTAAWAARGIALVLLLLALWLAYSWAWDRGRDYERARWEAASARIEAADTKADAAGMIAAAQTKGKVDAINQRAADAAAQSDDPLAAGFGELRKQGAGKGN